VIAQVSFFIFVIAQVSFFIFVICHLLQRKTWADCIICVRSCLRACASIPACALVCAGPAVSVEGDPPKRGFCCKALKTQNAIFAPQFGNSEILQLDLFAKEWLVYCEQIDRVCMCMHTLHKCEHVYSKWQRTHKYAHACVSIGFVEPIHISRGNAAVTCSQCVCILAFVRSTPSHPWLHINIQEVA